VVCLAGRIYAGRVWGSGLELAMKHRARCGEIPPPRSHNKTGAGDAKYRLERGRRPKVLRYFAVPVMVPLASMVKFLAPLTWEAVAANPTSSPGEMLMVTSLEFLKP